MEEKESTYNIQQYSIENDYIYDSGFQYGYAKRWEWEHTIYNTSVGFEIDWDREIIRTTSFKYKGDFLDYDGDEEGDSTTYSYEDSWQTLNENSSYNHLVNINLQYGVEVEPNIGVTLDKETRTVWYNKEKTRTLIIPK